jgi:FKBP-type peptidyl-prolyl cis-trans isomerase
MRLVTALAAIWALSAGCRSKSNDASSPASSSSGESKVARGIEPVVPKIPPPPDVAAPPADAEKVGADVFTKVLGPGAGTVHPSPSDLVEVKYTGWTRKGETVEDTPAPISFILDKAFPAFVDVLQLMVEGETRRLWVPMAGIYGNSPPPNYPAGDLTYDLALMKVLKKGPPPPEVPAPPDVKAPPKDAKRTKSGLSYHVLSPGSGKQPSATDTVSVNYSGWTPDGKMFDSSVRKKAPFVFRLDQVIKGWTEGLQLMKVGEKARFWIPSTLAYGDSPARPGAPSGPLVFDIELVEIKEQ